MSDNGDTVDTIPRTAPAPAQPQLVRFGEELPVFCERCGYSLHGLIQIRCHTCAVLHFSCPECGHHQPINTLRPAFQRTLGRLRAQGLAIIAFLKINFFFWTLCMWGGAGGGIAYDYNYYGGGRGTQFTQARFLEEVGIGTFLFGLAYAMVSRMLLLRWPRGWKVGLTLAALVVTAMYVGAEFRHYEQQQMWVLPSPIGRGFVEYMLCAFVGVLAGSMCAWVVWVSLVHVFLPKRAGTALLEWQRHMSVPDPKPGRADAATSVTV